MITKKCRNFVAVNVKTKRHIASWVLLAVFVPMLLLSSLHVHHQGETSEQSCTECVHHHCSGHFTQLIPTIHQCLLCQFVTLPFIAVAAVSLFFLDRAYRVNVEARRHHVSMTHLGIVCLRAPPAFFV